MTWEMSVGSREYNKRGNCNCRRMLKGGWCHLSTPSSALTSSSRDCSSFSAALHTSNSSSIRLSSVSTPSKLLQLVQAPRFSTIALGPKVSTCRAEAALSTIKATGENEVRLPPALTSTSDPPPVFDGTTRLYISYTCPFAQRAWITRNAKGLQDEIQLVPINLRDRPVWYKEKVYPPNKVPALEHKNEVKGESLDLINYIDTHFEGPSLFPDDHPAKKEFGEEVFNKVDSFTKSVVSSFKGEGDEYAVAAFDEIERALAKFGDGPFFLGQFSRVDIAYAPFIERYVPYLLEVKNIDITEGRPSLSRWIEEINKNEAYTETRNDPKVVIESYKKRFGGVV